MPVPIILAHGALGPFDELIMLGAAVIFLVMMGISWVKSRNTRPEFAEQEEMKRDQPETTAAPDAPAPTAPDRFKLD